MQTQKRLVAATLLSAAFAFGGAARAQTTAPHPETKRAKSDPAAADAAATAETAPKKPRRLPFRGKISTIEADKKWLIVKGKTGVRTFMIHKNTKIIKDGKPGTFAMAKPGDEIGGYAEKGKQPNTYKVLTLRIGPKPKKLNRAPPHPEPAPASDDPEPAKSK